MKSHESDKPVGKPVKHTKPYKWTDIKTQQAIFADRSAGLTVRQIAEKYGVHANTVSSICKKFAKEDPRTELAQGLLSGCRDRLEVKAVKAVESGLDCSDNPYKAGNLGVSVLKGLGVFNDESFNVHINQLFNSVPPEWRERYLVTNSPEVTEETRALIASPIVTIDPEEVKGGGE